MINNFHHIKHRIDSLDVLRAIGIFMVVFNHVVNRFYYNASLSSITWLIAVIYFCFHNGTSLFFMVSGVAFLKPGHEIKVKPFLACRLWRVVIPSLFWILITQPFFCKFESEISIVL